MNKPLPVPREEQPQSVANARHIRGGINRAGRRLKNFLSLSLSLLVTLLHPPSSPPPSSSSLPVPASRPRRHGPCRAPCCAGPGRCGHCDCDAPLWNCQGRLCHGQRGVPAPAAALHGRQARVGPPPRRPAGLCQGAGEEARGPGGGKRRVKNSTLPASSRFRFFFCSLFFFLHTKRTHTHTRTPHTHRCRDCTLVSAPPRQLFPRPSPLLRSHSPPSPRTNSSLHSRLRRTM